MKEIQYLTGYRVLKKIATGGMGSVYLAEQQGAESFRKITAIKTIKREYLKNKENVELFVGEAKLVADLIHENILQVYQLGQTKGIYYIVMEYAHGKNLSDYIREHKNRQKVSNVEIGAFIAGRVARAPITPIPKKTSTVARSMLFTAMSRHPILFLLIRE